MHDLVKAAQILGSCLLIGCGVLAIAIGTPVTGDYRHFGGEGAAAGGVCALIGLWLLITAWAGKNPVALVFGSSQESKASPVPPAPNKPPAEP